MIEDPEMEASVKFWDHVTGPTEIERDHVLTQAVVNAHTQVFGKPPIVDIDVRVSMDRMIDRCKYGGTDIGNFYEAGIPGINYGPAGPPVTPDERVSIPQLINHCKVSALVALNLCEAR